MNRKAKYLAFVFLQFLIVLNAQRWGMEPMPEESDMGPRQYEGEPGMSPWQDPMVDPSMNGNSWDQYPKSEEESRETSPGPDMAANRDPYYSSVCTAKDRCVTSCPADYQDGCVCYNDGTCMEQSVNRCHQCTDPEVYAVFEGQYCPRRHPNVCRHFHHHHWDKWCHRGHHRGFHKHHRHEWESMGLGTFVDCKEKVNSCVCKKTGECSMKLLSLCDECRAEHYLAIFVNSTCPDSSLNATCNATNGENPAPTTCNYPYAYLCQAQDRVNTTCDLQSSAQACVCYTNGTCISQPASACACQRADIVSVYPGSFCPTNCTGNPVAVEQPEEQTEEQSEGESEGNSENGESTPEEESSESSPMSSFEDEFSPSNPYRSFNCSIPQAYQCQDSDRNATNCSDAAQQSCICNTQGVCIGVVSNKCNACSKSDIASIYEGGYCPSNCSANSQAANSTESQAANSTESSESEESTENNEENSENDESEESSESNQTSNNSSATSLSPATANQIPDNNTIPQTGAGGNAPIQPTAAVPAQNYPNADPNAQDSQTDEDAKNAPNGQEGQNEQNSNNSISPNPVPSNSTSADSITPAITPENANNISNSTIPSNNTLPGNDTLSKPEGFSDVNPIPATF